MKYFAIILILFQNCSSCFAQEKQTTVYFNFNESILTKTTIYSLDSFCRIIPMKLNNFAIEIVGYCDSIGTDEYNKTLSQQRADEVKNYLLKKGLQYKMIANTKGLGKIRNSGNIQLLHLNRKVNIHFKEIVVIDTSNSFIKKIASAKVGDKIELPNIYFEGGRHTVLPTSNYSLKLLVDIMKAFPSLKIELQGHICCQHDKKDGYDPDLKDNKLSENRAFMVRMHLINKGIDEKRIRYKGFGSSNPAYNNIDDPRNRRVDVLVLEK